VPTESLASLASHEAQVQRGMREAVGRMGPLLEAAVTRQGMVHEVSCIVSDPGSPRQCVHADTIYMPCRQFPLEMPPLYTFFIALQDISDDMGHTTFLPRTHTEVLNETPPVQSSLLRLNLDVDFKRPFSNVP
jgi:ectoine hydroxylase-related dioxygenase (phytanoyl-CoA dioxygenase family)